MRPSTARLYLVPVPSWNSTFTRFRKGVQPLQVPINGPMV